MNRTPNPRYKTCTRNGPVLGLFGLGNQWPSLRVHKIWFEGREVLLKLSEYVALSINEHSKTQVNC